MALTGTVAFFRSPFFCSRTAVERKRKIIDIPIPNCSQKTQTLNAEHLNNVSRYFRRVPHQLLFGISADYQIEYCVTRVTG